jgi:hypothetical protein
MTPAEKARTAYHCHVAQHGCGGIRRAEADRLWKLRMDAIR